MKRTLALMVAVLTALVTATSLPTSAAAAAPTVHEGVIDGAKFWVTVPDNWTGEVFLYSHGHYAPNAEVPPVTSGYPLVEQKLLSEGYALAASAYRTKGWAVEDGLRDQIALLDWIGANLRRPTKVYAWGLSMGGLTSILLAERNPGRFAGVLSACGPDGGSVPFWNQWLDMGFVVKTLLDPGLQLTGIQDPAANNAKALATLRAATTSPQGLARIALANAMTDVPAWFGGPRPSTLADELFHEAVYAIGMYRDNTWGATRVEVEQRSGGNPSWNVGVDYGRLLARSTTRPLVERAYAAAGLDLQADLAALAAAPRIAPDAGAAFDLARDGTPLGATRTPVVTLHTTEDGLTGAEQTGWYAKQVSRFGNPRNLRQLWVDRANHCRWSQAEVAVAIDALIDRVHSGRWPDTAPATLNTEATGYGPDWHRMLDYWVGAPVTVTPSFVDHRPTPMLRPFPF